MKIIARIDSEFHIRVDIFTSFLKVFYYSPFNGRSGSRLGVKSVKNIHQLSAG